MPYCKDTGEWLSPEQARAKKEAKKAENKAKFWANKGVGKDLPREPISTVAGKKQRMQEFKEKLLTEHNGEMVIRKVLEIAQRDDHPGQMAALKLCMDRMLPTAMFESKKDGGRAAIQITISGVNDPEPKLIEGEVINES